MVSEKTFAVRFTAAELYELDCLLANGVCDYENPSNAVAAAAYEKIGRASAKFRIAPAGRSILDGGRDGE